MGRIRIRNDLKCRIRIQTESFQIHTGCIGDGTFINNDVFCHMGRNATRDVSSRDLSIFGTYRSVTRSYHVLLWDVMYLHPPTF